MKFKELTAHTKSEKTIFNKNPYKISCMRDYVKMKAQPKILNYLQLGNIRK